MNKYQVYLTTKETIYLEAECFYTNYEYGIVRFVQDSYYNTSAIFVLSNIFGFEKVDEFDVEEPDNG